MTEADVLGCVFNGPATVEHYKGNEYTVVGVAHFSEDPNKRLVMYLDKGKGKWYVRPLTEKDKINPMDTPFCGQVSETDNRERFKLRAK